MTTFTDSATAFLADRAEEPREVAWRRFEEVGLPTPADEVWRYAPLGELDLSRYGVGAAPSGVAPSALAASLAERAAIVVRVIDGYVVSVDGFVDGITVTSGSSAESLTGDLLTDRYAGDAFALLNAALAPTVTEVRVAAGVELARPILIWQATGASASFARTSLVLERGARATVVEYFEGGEGALVVPVSEYGLGENAELRLVTYQHLEPTAWHVARTTGFLDRDARLYQAVIGVGAHYDRSRNDAELRGAGSANELRTTYLGVGDQVHDYRTRQLHLGARTTSTLLSKGAVGDESRSVYTGLIEIEKGAKKTDARQTNHNLLLSPSAHADSVPNLEIRENDVQCAHASSVGPLDELQRWYLESRGVPRVEAERLLIRGFFYEMLTALPPDVAATVEADVDAAVRAVEVVAR